MLFKKAAVITDLHFGRSGNSPVANQDNIDFLEWFIDEAKSRGCETCVMAGDYHDNRHSVHVSTMDYSLRGMEMLDAAFSKSYWIPGNHDLFYRDKRDISSIAFAKHLPNIEIVRDPTTIGDVTFLPWLVGEEHKALKTVKGRYVFAHLEVPGFLMNAKVEMPDSPHTVKPDQFQGVEYVFTGHFHMRQAKDHIVYIGNIMPFNFADAWDEDRGAMFLDWGKDPQFVSWPDQPVYRTLKLSDLVNQPDKILRPKLTARVTIDIDITYEEAQAIRDVMVKDYGLRKIELVHSHKGDEGDQEFKGEAIFQSVDQIVVDGLMSVQSIGMKPERLVDIYRSLSSS